MEAYFAARAVSPDRITYSQDGTKTRVAKKGRLGDLARDPSTRRLTLWRLPTKEAPGTHDLRTYLRPMEDVDPRFAVRDVSSVWATELRSLDRPLLDVLRALVTLYPVAQGGVGSYASSVAASHECLGSMGDVRQLPPGVEARLHEDALRRYQFGRQLRRLYPVTIIGREIWAALPPMPTFDPMPVIEELGDCKLVTAWPTLCDPRDPAFLRGTRDLRAWLWPYTIQNPADHVDHDPVD